MQQQEEILLKRQALNLAAQLPDSPADAARVLEYAKEIVESFWPKGQEAARLLRFPGGGST